MLPENYTQTKANKLSKLSVPEITEPFGIRILWLRSVAYESSRKIISRHRHKHSYFEAHFIFTGAMKYDVDGEISYDITPDSGIIVSPEVSHTASDFNSELVRISMAFTVNTATETFKRLSARKAHVFKIGKDMLYAFERIFSELDEKGTLSPYLIRGYVFDILCSVIRSSDAEGTSCTKADGDGTDLRVATAIRYIEDNKNIFLTCEDVAKYCHFNVKYLNRIFKAKTSLTLLEYIHKVKITEAERLLAETELSLCDVSAMLGFTNVYYFNSFFKRSCAISPGTYRKLIKK